MAWLSELELKKLSFGSVGAGALISERASFYNCANIYIGNNVRIDDFCVLSAGAGGIRIGNFVHIAVHCSLIGAGAIRLANYCNLSSRVSIYSSTDDFSGLAMTNPMVPAEFTQVMAGDVTLAEHVIVGSGSVILPGVSMADGVAVGALSLVTEDCDAFGIYGGIPATRIKERSRALLEAEKQFAKSQMK